MKVNLCQPFMEIRLQSIGVYSGKNFWKPPSPGHRVDLFCQRFRSHQIWRFKKSQCQPVICFKQIFLTITLDSQTESSFQTAWSIHVSQSITVCCLESHDFDSWHGFSLECVPHLPVWSHLPRTLIWIPLPPGSLPRVLQISVISPFSNVIMYALAPHFWH